MKRLKEHRIIILLFILLLIIQLSFFSYVSAMGFAIPVGAKLLGTLLTALGISLFTVTGIISTYELWSNSANSYYINLLKNIETNSEEKEIYSISDIPSSLWSEVNSFINNNFEEGSHDGITGGDSSSSTLNSSNSDFDVYWAEFGTQYTIISSADALAGFRVSEETIINDQGIEQTRVTVTGANNVFIDSQTFGNHFEEHYFGVQFEPDIMFLAEIWYIFEGATSYLIGNIPVASYGPSHLTLEYENSISLDLPYSYNPSYADYPAIAFPHDVSILTGVNSGLIADDPIGWVESVPDIPLNPPVDLSGITGLLSSISGLISGILDFLTNLFVIPDNIASLDFSPFYNLQLSNKFPFSVPWDLYKAVAGLTGSASPPIFHFSILGQEVTWDLAIFEPLANIMRWSILAIFNVGLITVTRNYIGAGGGS